MNSAPGRMDVLFDVLSSTGQTEQPMVNNGEAGNSVQPDAQLTLDRLMSILHQAFPTAELSPGAGKKSFLVFKNNKYISINTQDIAYIYMHRGAATIVTYKEQQFSQSRSLDQIQSLLPLKDFFRINRQYLISFDAIKEAEHYFSRKLLVNLTIPSPEKLLVAKEKASAFLQWLDCR
jgi:DNA-binding LytR/AlgR family response regulator